MIALPLFVQLLLAVVTIAGLSVLTVRSPRRAVLLLLVLVPLYEVRWTFGPLPTTLLELGIGGFLIGSIVLLWRERIIQHLTAWKTLPVWVWIFTALVIWAGVSITWAADPLHGLGLWRAFFLEPLLVLIALAMMLRVDLISRDDLMRGVLMSMIIPISIGVAQLFGWGTIAPWHRDGPDFRVTSIFMQPNMVALFLAPLVAVVFFSRYAVFAKIIILLGVCAIILGSRSDGGLIAAGIGLVGMIAFQLLRRPGFAKGFFMLLLAGTIVFPFVARPLTDRFAIDLGPSHHVRLDLIDVSFTYLKSHPIIGTGIGNFAATTPEWIPFVSGYPAAHTLLLNIMAELGLLGAILFYALLVSVLWLAASGAHRHTRDASAISSGRDLMGFTPFPAIGIWMLSIMMIHSVVDVSFFKNDLAILFIVALLFTWRAQSGTLARHGADVHTSGQ